MLFWQAYISAVRPLRSVSWSRALAAADTMLRHAQVSHLGLPSPKSWSYPSPSSQPSLFAHGGSRMRSLLDSGVGLQQKLGARQAAAGVGGRGGHHEQGLACPARARAPRPRTRRTGNRNRHLPIATMNRMISIPRFHTPPPCRPLPPSPIPSLASSFPTRFPHLFSPSPPTLLSESTLCFASQPYRLARTHLPILPSAMCPPCAHNAALSKRSTRITVPPSRVMAQVGLSL